MFQKTCSSIDRLNTPVPLLLCHATQPNGSKAPQCSYSYKSLTQLMHIKLHKRKFFNIDKKVHKAALKSIYCMRHWQRSLPKIIHPTQLEIRTFSFCTTSSTTDKMYNDKVQKHVVPFWWMFYCFFVVNFCSGSFWPDFVVQTSVNRPVLYYSQE